jgi:hypothetical protein
MQKNVPNQKILIFAWDSIAEAPKTGLTNITGYISLDGGTPVALSGNASEVDATNMPGIYSWTPSQAQTNADDIYVVSKSVTAGVQIDPVRVSTRAADAVNSYSFATASTTAICNMALGRIGAKQITDLAADTSVVAQQCRLHFVQTRDALLRSFNWPFATQFSALSASATLPTAEYAYAYDLPADYLRLADIYDNTDKFRIIGSIIMSDVASLSIYYVAKVTDVSLFEPLFTEIFILQLAMKLLPALGGTNTGSLKADLWNELQPLISRCRTVSLQEGNYSGSSDWNNAKFASQSYQVEV